MELTTKIEHYFDIIGIEEKIFMVLGCGVRVPSSVFRVLSFEFLVPGAGCVVRDNEFRGHGAEELQDAVDLAR